MEPEVGPPNRGALPPRYPAGSGHEVKPLADGSIFPHIKLLSSTSLGPSLQGGWLWSRSDQLRGTTSRMAILRLFIIALSVARLIRKERGGERVLEGYFPDQPHRLRPDCGNLKQPDS